MGVIQCWLSHNLHVQAHYQEKSDTTLCRLQLSERFTEIRRITAVNHMTYWQQWRHHDASGSRTIQGGIMYSYYHKVGYCAVQGQQQHHL